MPRTIFKNILIQNFKEATEFEFCKYTSIRFFEILFFQEGEGEIKINDTKVKYKKDKLFFFIPNDEYVITVEKPTTVFSVKFLNSFFQTPLLYQSTYETNEWFKKIEYISNTTLRLGNFSFKPLDEQDSLLALLKVLCNESSSNQPQKEVILSNILASLLHILVRNLKTTSIAGTAIKESSKIQYIIDYIHYNIYELKKLSSKSLASEFNIAESYFGQYFKKKMGFSLKNYILNYKLKLIENKMKYTDLNISEIAVEFGFTDTSHLNKTFMSQKGISIKDYRESIK